MKLKSIITALIIIVINCSLFDPDPYGCNSRGPLIVSDVKMENGIINQYYNEPINETNQYGFSQIIDTTLLPPGLKAIDSIRTLFIQCIPTQTGNYAIKVKVSEEGTQCSGRSATFTAKISITQ